MTCSFDTYFDCPEGFSYYYRTCCDAGWTLFWNILMYVSICLCVMFCCCMMFSFMRRRRMQMAAAQRRNHQAGRHDSSSSSDSFHNNNNNNNRPRSPNRAAPYNAPIGGPSYAPPTMAAAPLPVGIRPMVNETKPKTAIRINLYTGQSVTLDVNLDHTVADIHTYVMSVAPINGSYQLMSGYPPRPLADPSKTIKDAKLENANVTMAIV